MLHDEERVWNSAKGPCDVILTSAWEPTAIPLLGTAKAMPLLCFASLAFCLDGCVIMGFGLYGPGLIYKFQQGGVFLASAATT
ncbi:hypothetical protein TorRG33x02_089170 [Trema orientale]|uniref:Uncharacterized protein n=1 Tax=Trema orientale TaxID=63057 RepID=A0A2P5FCA1_TREOI|nr:hypothetical protein TorRG33x02_089170 [Trema orientale]